MPPVTERLAPLRRPGGFAWVLLGGLVAGALAIAILVFAHHANPKYVSVAFGALAVVVLLPLVGDVRLFCLYAIVLLSPIGLRLSFLLYPHMGGAPAVFVEVVDPFMFLLLYHQLRDRFRGTRSTYRFPPTFAIWGAMSYPVSQASSRATESTL